MFYVYENDLNPAFVSFSVNRHKNVKSTAHINYYGEIAVCLEGTLEVRVNHKSRILHAGDGTYIPSFEVHEYLEGENDVYVFCFSPLIFAGLIQNLPVSDKNVGHLSDEALLYIKRLAGDNISCCGDERRIQLLMNCLLYEIPCTPEKHEREESLTICRAIKYLEENYEERITLADVAREMGVNRTYVSRMFSKYLSGATFVQVLSELRIYHAIELMKDRTVARAALEAGFGSVRQFNRVFKEKTGITPAEYKGEGTEDKMKIEIGRR